MSVLRSIGVSDQDTSERVEISECIDCESLHKAVEQCEAMVQQQKSSLSEIRRDLFSKQLALAMKFEARKASDRQEYVSELCKTVVDANSLQNLEEAEKTLKAQLEAYKRENKAMKKVLRDCPDLSSDSLPNLVRTVDSEGKLLLLDIEERFKELQVISGNLLTIKAVNLTLDNIRVRMDSDGRKQKETTAMESQDPAGASEMRDRLEELRREYLRKQLETRFLSDQERDLDVALETATNEAKVLETKVEALRQQDRHIESEIDEMEQVNDLLRSLEVV